MITITSTIILPQKTNDGKPIAESLHNGYLADICLKYGGYTETVGKGGWIDDKNGQHYKDDVYVVTVSTSLVRFFEVRGFLTNLAKIVKRDLLQQAVYINIGNVLTYFV